MTRFGDLDTFSVEPLARKHKRAEFSCGNEALDRYLTRQATQDAKRRVAAPFVAITPNNQVIGYYTLSAFSIELPKLPAAQSKKLPRYPTVPATLLGRLAVDNTRQGTGFGEFLLMDALSRSSRATAEVASYAVVVDAIDDAAVTFYQRYDFVLFPNNPDRLFLPMAMVEKLFR